MFAGLSTSLGRYPCYNPEPQVLLLGGALRQKREKIRVRYAGYAGYASGVWCNVRCVVLLIESRVHNLRLTNARHRST